MTRFLGAFNDNLLKILIIFYLIRVRGVENSGAIAALAGAAFVIPFLLFSDPAN